MQKIIIDLDAEALRYNPMEQSEDDLALSKLFYECVKEETKVGEKEGIVIIKGTIGLYRQYSEQTRKAINISSYISFLEASSFEIIVASEKRLFGK